MSTILLKGILLNGAVKDILIKGNRIASIGTSLAVPDAPCKIVDCTGKAAVPGFVNMHTHSAMTLTRGYREDAKLQDWLRK